jgi:hypothetical protein
MRLLVIDHGALSRLDAFTGRLFVHRPVVR